MTTDVHGLVERVRKLLALAGSANPHEAALAAGRAQALIARHRLEAWIDPPADPDPIVDARDAPLAVARRLRKWKVVLAMTLAELNGTVAYTLDRGADEAIILVGRAADREAVAALWEWLVHRLELLSATHGAGRDRAWHEAFRIGAIDVIAARLREASSEAESATSGLTALPEATSLVLSTARQQHDEALRAFVDKTLGLRGGRAIRVDAAGWRAGHAAGASLPLPGSS